MNQDRLHESKGPPVSGKGLGVWISRCKLLHIGWINNKDLLNSTVNYIQHPMINHNVKEYRKNIYIYVCVCVCVLLSHFVHMSDDVELIFKAKMCYFKTPQYAVSVKM